MFFLTAIWLPHGQLWPIIEGAGTLTVINHQEPRNEVGSLTHPVSYFYCGPQVREENQISNEEAINHNNN